MVEGAFSSLLIYSCSSVLTDLVRLHIWKACPFKASDLVLDGSEVKETLLLIEDAEDNVIYVQLRFRAYYYSLMNAEVYHLVYCVLDGLTHCWRSIHHDLMLNIIRPYRFPGKIRERMSSFMARTFLVQAILQ